MNIQYRILRNGLGHYYVQDGIAGMWTSDTKAIDMYGVEVVNYLPSLEAAEQRIENMKEYRELERLRTQWEVVKVLE